jgi:Tol biopolymer transport system component
VSLEPGRRIGPYEVVGRLGAGGMGEVFRARDTRLAREVALKILPPEVSRDPGRRQRFEREARAVAALNHPSVLALYDVGESDGVAYLVTELLEGETLRERLRRGTVACERVAEWGAAAADALAAAHQRGIVHRDLKPENLFVTRDGRLKVLDFGLAKEWQAAAGGDEDPTLSSPTRRGVVLGTLGYLSPEQARGEPVDGRSDVFSLGCVLFEGLCGKRAFDGGTAQDLIAAVLRDDPPDPSSLRPDAPPALARVVSRCLAKEREARFQSASDLAFVLRSLAQGSGAPVAHAVPAPRRLPLGWPLVAFGVGVASLAAGYWLRGPGELAEPMVFALTPGSSREAGPAISADGKFVAYLASVGGRTDVWVKFVGGGPAANLTADSGLEFQGQAAIGGLEISPDGSAIAVQAGAPGSDGLRRAVWLIPAPLGGPPRKLIERAAGLRWSPDGSRVVFMRPDPVGGDSIVVARPDGSDERVVVPPSGVHTHEPAWSADGSWIYFDRGLMVSDEGPTEIWRVPSGGGAVEPVVQALGVAQAPLPTPDGRGLVYAGNQSGDTLNIWWRPIAGGRERRLTYGAGDYIAPRISRDGRRLVCEARTSIGSLRAVDSSATAMGPGQELTQAGAGDEAPTTARSGRIAFSSVRNGASDIWISEADGRDPRPLTSDPEPDSAPAISPDGSRVAFVSSRDGRRGLWLVSADGGAPRSLGATGVLERASWAPDGRTIVYAAIAVGGESRLWTLSVDGGTPHAIPGVTGRGPAWSPEGDLIAYQTSIPPKGPQIRFTDSSGKPRLTEVEVAPPAVEAISFSWDGRRLAVASSPGAMQGSLFVFDLDSGRQRRVTGLGPFSGVRGIAWSTDDKRLIYGLALHESRILLFDGLGRF